MIPIDTIGPKRFRCAKHGECEGKRGGQQYRRVESAQVAFKPFEGELSDMLYRDHKGVNVVVVNSLIVKTCQRFTVAHVIGHLLLHEASWQVDRPINVRFRDERSGFAFAAALLIPRDWVLTGTDWLLRRNRPSPMGRSSWSWPSGKRSAARQWRFTSPTSGCGRRSDPASRERPTRLRITGLI